MAVGETVDTIRGVSVVGPASILESCDVFLASELVDVVIVNVVVTWNHAAVLVGGSPRPGAVSNVTSSSVPLEGVTSDVEHSINSHTSTGHFSTVDEDLVVVVSSSGFGKLVITQVGVAAVQEVALTEGVVHEWVGGITACFDEEERAFRALLCKFASDGRTRGTSTYYDKIIGVAGGLTKSWNGAA